MKCERFKAPAEIPATPVSRFPHVSQFPAFPSFPIFSILPFPDFPIFRSFPLFQADPVGSTRASRPKLDRFMVTVMTKFVNMLTVSKAKATFSGIARKVVRSKNPVIVRVPDGFIQIAPYELPEEVAPIPAGSLKLRPREVALPHTFGESL